MSAIQRTGLEAVETLVKIMRDSGSPPLSRVSSAQALLDLLFRVYEIRDRGARGLYQRIGEDGVGERTPGDARAPET